MGQFGRSLFSGTSWIFWVLAPIALVCALLFGLVAYGGLRSGDWLAGGIALALTLACVLLILALWGRGMAWAGRVLCGMVSLAYAIYLVHEWGWESESLSEYHGRGDAHPINATLGFLVIGIPCGLYAVLGRFTWRQAVEEMPFEDDEAEEDEDDESADLEEQKKGGNSAKG